MKRKTFLELTILAALITITLLGTAHGAFADCSDDDECWSISCSDCCEEGYTEYYRCSGSSRQRLWQYSDCMREWRTIDTCSYGCTDGYCACEAVIAEVSPSTPADRFEYETAHTTIKINNLDDRGAWFNLQVYLCEAGSSCNTWCDTSCDTSCDTDCGDSFASNCREMSCDDTHVYVPADGRRYAKCSRLVKKPGDYRIKVVYSSDNYRTKRTVYSDVFEVRGECSAGTEGDYRCFGKYRQQKYIDEDCDARWKIVEYCPYGCEGSVCVQPAEQPKVGEPEVFMRTNYEMEKCGLSSFTFTIHNKGEADTFSIDVGGDAAGWIDVVPTASIGKGETKAITAYASIPCSAAAGEHEFTITASGKTSDSRVGVVKIAEKQGLFNTRPADDLAIAALIIVSFALAVVFFRGGLSKMISGLLKGRGAGAEEFKTSFISKMLKKV